MDLVGSDKRAGATQVAVCRVEQLYPLPSRDLRAMLDGYSAADEIVWVQEEPENMGSWDFVRPYLEDAAERPAVRLHRAAAQREPGGRVVGAPRAASADPGRGGARAVARKTLEATARTGTPSAAAGEGRTARARYRSDDMP